MLKKYSIHIKVIIAFLFLSIVANVVFLFIKPFWITSERVMEVKAMPKSTEENAYTNHFSNTKLYFGVHVPGWLNDLSNVIEFEHDAKKKVSIVMIYQGWGLTDGTQNFEQTWMDTIRNHGSIPLVTWEPWLYTNGVTQPQYSLHTIITGNFDAYITKWALDSKAWGHPYFLRFAHEMNGNYYPWSEQVNGNKPGEYVQAWKHVHDIFTKNNVTNVTWVWSPNISYSGSNPLQPLYPGDAYVDWIGMDGYNWGTIQNHTWQSLTDVFQETYDEITTLSQKPLMIAETASTEQGGDKATWITEAFSPALMKNFPRVKAFIWFNENKESDWRIESSPAATKAFAQAIAAPVYLSNQFANLEKNPIPTPYIQK